MKLGLIAGGGDLPRHVLAGALHDGNEVSLIALKGFANPADFTLANFPTPLEMGVAQYGKMLKAFKKNKVTHICFAGNVKRPDFKRLKPDLKGFLNMPGAVMAAKNGDDALLRYILGLFEKEGFEIVAPQDICQSLLLTQGMLGAVPLAQAHKEDARRACEIAAQIGALDIGQGAVVCMGVVLAVEAQEGTDAMLSRTAELPAEIKGTPLERKGVLAKMVKPDQEMRVDLPTIGPQTVRLAAAAGLAGIVAEAGRCFVMEKETVISLADEAGLFIAGLPPASA